MLKKVPAMAGFAAGALACLLFATAGHGIITGQGLGDPAPQTVVVYPNW